MPIAPPTITAPYCRVYNLDTAEEYYAKAATTEDSTYSLVKCLTALVLLGRRPTVGDLTEVVTIVAADLTAGGTGANLQEGDEITLHNLLRNMFLPSSNNSALAVARVIGQEILDEEMDEVTDPVDRFITEMDVVATALGITTPTWESVHGGSADQAASITDMTTIFAELVDNAIMQEIWKWHIYPMPLTRSTPITINITSTVTVLTLPGVYGGKTGSSGTAFHNLVWLWEAPNGQRLIGGVMGSTSTANRLADVEAILAELLVDFTDLATSADPWTPTVMYSDLTAGGAWLDFTDPSTIWADTGMTTLASIDGAVAAVSDKSGNGNHATQATSGNRPILRNSGSDYWLEFDGSNDFLTFGTGTIDGTGLFADGGEEFMVITHSAVDSAGSGTILARAVATAGSRVFQLYHDNSVSAATPGAYFRGGFVSPSFGLNDGVARTFGAIWDGSVGGMAGGGRAICNITPGSATESGTDHVVVGARTNGTGFFFNGNIYQVLIVDKADFEHYRRATSYVGGFGVNAFADPAAGGGGATYTLTADAGSFAISGTAASLEVSRLIEAETGSFAIAGVAANLIVSRVLSAESGSFAIAGIDAGLIASRVLSADAGAIAISGTDADLIYTPISGPDYTLSAEPGAVAIAGTAASLIASRKLSAEPGEIEISGTTASLLVSRNLSAEPGTIAINGTDAQLKASRVLACLPGLIQISGTAADLVWSGETPTVPSGVFLSRENQFHRLFFAESKNKQRLFSAKPNKKQRLFE